MAYRGSKGKAEVLEILRDQMLFLELKPGESIQDSELARKLDVSRTPVREALLALQKEGLVDIYPQSGTFVSRIDMELLSEIAYIRRMVEGDVFRTLVGQKANLRGRLEKFILLQELAARENNLKDYVVNDHLFHQALFRAAGHARAWTVIEPHFRFICCIFSPPEGLGKSPCRSIGKSSPAWKREMMKRQTDFCPATTIAFPRIRK